MAKRKREPVRYYVGTDDLIGATCIKTDWQEFTFEKDGRTFVLVEEAEFAGTCMCEGRCCCGADYPSYHMRLYELK